jgi:hypothetical protein
MAIVFGTPVALAAESDRIGSTAVIRCPTSRKRLAGLLEISQ